MQIRNPLPMPAALCLAAFLAFAASKTIKPGEAWPDNRGQHIQAHGGGIIKVADTWYWFGEDRSQGLDPAKRYVSCYSSKDLAHWTFRNQVMKQSDPGDLGPRFVLERPKVFYNAKTRKYVMYMHIDDAKYALARVGVAVSDTVDGDYQFLRSFRPLGQESRDIGQFIDDDGSAYLIFEDRPAKGFHIAKLSEDYLSVESDVCSDPGAAGGRRGGSLPGALLRAGFGADGLEPQSQQVRDVEKPGRPLVGIPGHRAAGGEDLRVAIHHAAEGGRVQGDHRDLHGRHLEAANAVGLPVSLDAGGNR